MNNLHATAQNSAALNGDDVSLVQHNFFIRLLAQLFSYLFHPLFIPTYIIAFLMYVHPAYFSGFSAYEKGKLMAATILNTAFFPLIAVLLMKGLGFISSVFLHTQRDRIGPYLSSMIFYFWAAWVFFKFEPRMALVVPSFMTGVFLTTVAGLLTNVYFKISMHAMAMGGVLGIGIIIMLYNTMLMTWPLSAAILITGIVCTSRLIVSNHTTKEIYWGLLVGILCQAAAAIIIL
jgi:hypothetical protein